MGGRIAARLEADIRAAVERRTGCAALDRDRAGLALMTRIGAGAAGSVERAANPTGGVLPEQHDGIAKIGTCGERNLAGLAAGMPAADHRAAAGRLDPGEQHRSAGDRDIGPGATVSRTGEAADGR